MVVEILKYSEFTNPDHWIGGFYELSMEFHPVGDNERLNQALMALQNLDFFNGLWKERQHYQSDTISLPVQFEDNSINQFYGTLTITDDTTLPCVVTIARITGDSDWFKIAIPQAILEKLFPLKYPLTPELNPWLVRIEELFIRITEKLYNSSPFELALFGEEISGYSNQESISCIMPNEVQQSLGILENGEELANQLRLFR